MVCNNSQNLNVVACLSCILCSLSEINNKNNKDDKSIQNGNVVSIRGNVFPLGILSLFQSWREFQYASRTRSPLQWIQCHQGYKFFPFKSNNFVYMRENFSSFLRNWIKYNSLIAELNSCKRNCKFLTCTIQLIGMIVKVSHFLKNKLNWP